MTLLFADSFDHYTAFPNVKGWTQQGTGGGVVGAFGRNGTNGLRFTEPDFGAKQNLAGMPGTVIVGVAFRVSALGGGDAPIVSLFDTGVSQVDVRLTALGGLRATRGGTSLALTPNGLIVPGQYNYLELMAKVDPAAGSLVVRLNSQSVINLAGINTQSTGASKVTHVVLCGVAGGLAGQDLDFDDCVICDGAGAKNNTLLGDVRVQALMPTGPGTYTQWDGLTGAASHWQAQADNPPDGDASYVSDTMGVAGHIDSYAMADLLASAGSVPAVQVSAWARKDDAGARTLSPMVRSAGVDALGAAQPLVATYAYATSVFENDPGGAAWTVGTVNGAEAGVKAVA